MKINDILNIDDGWDRFCIGCDAIQYVSNEHEKRGFFECQACNWDITSTDCLKYESYCKIQDAINMIDDAIEEKGSYSIDEI